MPGEEPLDPVQLGDQVPERQLAQRAVPHGGRPWRGAHDRRPVDGMDRERTARSVAIDGPSSDFRDSTCTDEECSTPILTHLHVEQQGFPTVTTGRCRFGSRTLG